MHPSVTGCSIVLKWQTVKSRDLSVFLILIGCHLEIRLIHGALNERYGKVAILRKDATVL